MYKGNGGPSVGKILVSCTVEGGGVFLHVHCLRLSSTLSVVSSTTVVTRKGLSRTRVVGDNKCPDRIHYPNAPQSGVYEFRTVRPFCPAGVVLFTNNSQD